jgi:predicted 3-demethylubiquinone-9 3-methyltransferase (glyoxalase superfamily)
MTQKITPFLWFDTQAEEAAKFYCSAFKNSRIVETHRYGKGAPAPEGTVMTVAFELEGQRFVALNGGPIYKFTEAISLAVDCKDQAEVDALWSRLTADGGAPVQCGWLKDKYGLSWQIVPMRLMELLKTPDPAARARVFGAMMKMIKIDIAALEAAAQPA